MLAEGAGVSSALFFSASVASAQVATAALVTGQSEQTDKALGVVAYGSGVGPLVGGTVGMLAHPSDPEVGLFVGTAAGGLAELAVAPALALRGSRIEVPTQEATPATAVASPRVESSPPASVWARLK